MLSNEIASYSVALSKEPDTECKLFGAGLADWARQAAQLEAYAIQPWIVNPTRPADASVQVISFFEEMMARKQEGRAVS